MSYFLTKTVELDFDSAIVKVTGELKKHGFGIVTELDVEKTLKEKIGVEIRKYKILGACNPHFAHQAITNEPMIGTLLPCNVVVHENKDGKTEVSLINPTSMFELVGKEDFKPLVDHVQKAFEEVLSNI